MSVGCELPIIDGRQCGIDAFERCAECQRAFCRSHQAWERTASGSLICPIQNWCAECQVTRQAKDKAAAKVSAREHAERVRAAKTRIAALLAELNVQGFPGAVERAVSKTVKGAFGRAKTITTQHEPAIPVGQVTWEFWTYHPRDGAGGFKHLQQLDTGITRSGEYVRMNPEMAGSDWKMSANCDIDICEVLEAHARKYL